MSKLKSIKSCPLVCRWTVFWTMSKHQEEFTEIINTLFCCTKSVCLVNYRCFLKISEVEIFIWHAKSRFWCAQSTWRKKTCACTRHALQTGPQKRYGEIPRVKLFYLGFVVWEGHELFGSRAFPKHWPPTPYGPRQNKIELNVVFVGLPVVDHMHDGIGFECVWKEIKVWERSCY